MRIPRFRIAWLAAIVALAAVDFAAIREGVRIRHQSRTPIIDALGLGALPMANVLAVGLLVLGTRRGSRSFLLGFEAFGAMALAAHIATASLYPTQLVMPYLLIFLSPLARAIGEPESVGLIVVFVFFAVVVLGLPQVDLALLGGLLCRKFQMAERSNQARD